MTAPTHPDFRRSLVVATTRAELAAARAALPGPVGVVPTMGALHEGHAALMRFARTECDSVITTIFVNPLQFGPNEDFDRYPRNLDADLALCAGEGVDVVFAPSTEEMYRPGLPSVRVDPGVLGSRLEGESRPGHFSGVLTVVAKLVNLTRPDRAYFGEKDFQQLALVRRMVSDLDLPVDIVGVPIVRDDDGVARSSRNRYLSTDERRAAAAIPAALAAGQSAAEQGRGPDEVRTAVLEVLDAEPGLRLDRLDLVEEFSLTGPPRSGVPARLLLAAFAGSTRLIDNVHVRLVRG
jgi:pantoate--beta-alanine ligase